MLGRPYGTKADLQHAETCIFSSSASIDEIRESAGAFATIILTGIRNGRFAPNVPFGLMGADADNPSVSDLSAEDQDQINRLGGGVARFLDDFEDGPMWDLFQTRDDVANEMLVGS
jgi:hypothetical protein